MAISLESITRGKRIRAPKVVIFGGPKTGKSTFGSQIPDAVFIQTEEGLDALDVAKFPMATSYQDVLDAVKLLATAKHDHGAVVLDSLDWLEPLIWQHLCTQHNVKSIELVGGGFGKGYSEALKLWRDLLDGLDFLRNERGMSVVLIAHDESKRMDPPDGEPYNYTGLKLHNKAAAMVAEWADVLGLAMQPRTTTKDDVGFNKKHVRAIGLGKNVLFVGKSPAFVTGNRFGLPDTIPLEWNAFVGAMSTAVNPPAAQAA